MIEKINRGDMLELTRRMTVSRNCFHRIAGAYLDSDGFVDGTFNTHFQKLSRAEQEQKLKLAKTILFAETNVAVKEYRFDPSAQKTGTVRQFLKGLLDSDLKNDALLDSFYEVFGEFYPSDHAYAIYFFLGKYDIPRMGTDKASQWESEDVYPFILCAICPVDADYNPQAPECGFLFPAYKDHGGAEDFTDVYGSDRHPQLLELLQVH